MNNQMKKIRDEEAERYSLTFTKVNDDIDWSRDIRRQTNFKAGFNRAVELMEAKAKILEEALENVVECPCHSTCSSQFSVTTSKRDPNKCDCHRLEAKSALDKFRGEE